MCDSRPGHALKFFAIVAVITSTSSLALHKVRAQPLEAPNPTAQVSGSIKLLSLNLHGYHPMGEPERWSLERDGSHQLRSSDLYYFTQEELERGSQRQLDALSDAIEFVQPDVIALQEVAAGLPSTDKSCDTFNDSNIVGDAFGANAAIRLSRRLLGYSAHLACRGNIGWITSQLTFAKGPIGWKDKKGAFSTVFNTDENPYPRGILVEGFALLVRRPWAIRENMILRIPFNRKGEIVVAQLGFIEDLNHGWMAVLNLHAGHKLAHFEQAVALRQTVLNIVNQRRESSAFQSRYLGTLMVGDFNSYLYNATVASEVSSIPWEIQDANRGFDFTSPATVRSALPIMLSQLNDDMNYKPWANISNKAEARDRIFSAVEALAQLLEEEQDSVVQREALTTAQNQSKCQPPAGIDAACDTDERIDHIFYEKTFHLTNAFVLFPQNDFKSTAGVSDHPGVMAEFSW